MRKIIEDRDKWKAKAEEYRKLLSMTRCAECDGSGFYIIETGGCGPDGENDTRECAQVECRWCAEYKKIMEDV